jgi:hypothetical protein
VRSLPFGKLHGKALDAPGRAVDANLLSFVQSGLVEQRLPCR